MPINDELDAYLESVKSYLARKIPDNEKDRQSASPESPSSYGVYFKRYELLRQHFPRTDDTASKARK